MITMKKIILFFALFAFTFCKVFSQPGNGVMTFVGKSVFYVTMNGQKAGETIQPSDTILYSGADFTLPSMSYGNMVIPSFQVKGTAFTGGYGGVIWEEQSFTTSVKDSSGEEKSISGVLQKGSLSHGDGIYKVSLEFTFSYGKMPFPITYNVEGYYVKDYSGVNSVTVGGVYGPYTADVTYKVRTYLDEEGKKVDVEVPVYMLNETAIGDLLLGTYTVKGLVYDEGMGGFYKDYSSDNLTMHFTASRNGVVSIDGDYPLSSAGCENIFVSLSNGKAKIVNNFQPGAMPFPISAVMDQNTSTEIEHIYSGTDDVLRYDIFGRRVSSSHQGLEIKGGRKYVNIR